MDQKWLSYFNLSNLLLSHRIEGMLHISWPTYKDEDCKVPECCRMARNLHTRTRLALLDSCHGRTESDDAAAHLADVARHLEQRDLRIVSDAAYVEKTATYQRAQHFHSYA